MGFRDQYQKLKIRVQRHAHTAGISAIRDPLARHWAMFRSLLRFYFRHPDYIFHRKSYLSNVELVLTTNCTLRCKNCCHYMPRYKPVPFEPAGRILRDLELLLGSVRRIDEFRVMGGEPLLYPELAKVVEYLLRSEKIGTVEIVTNGTLSPGEDLLRLFPNGRLNIHVSNYGALSKKTGEFAENPAINKTIAPKDMYWQDHGGLRYRGKSVKDLKRQYRRCSKDKCILYQGKLYSCACSAFGSDLQVFPLEQDEYADVRNCACPESLAGDIRKLRSRSYFTACNYCTWGTDQFVPIPPAEQL